MIDSVSDIAGATADLKKARRQKSARADARPTVDRLPPHSPEAEQGVLGCALLSPNECMGECIEKLKDNGDGSFLRPAAPDDLRNARGDVRHARRPIDIITLQQRLKDKQLLEQIGGIAYLSQLAGCGAERGESFLLSRNRPRKISAAENDPDLHGSRRARL